jgi:hypothetical protein
MKFIEIPIAVRRLNVHAVGRLNDFENFITNAISNTIFVLKEWYIGVLISLLVFLFAAQPKEFFLKGLKKLKQ